jgi:hypothetical protein
LFLQCIGGTRAAAIRAEERETPENRTKIEWKLITDLPVQSSP